MPGVVGPEFRVPEGRLLTMLVSRCGITGVVVAGGYVLSENRISALASLLLVKNMPV